MERLVFDTKLLRAAADSRCLQDIAYTESRNAELYLLLDAHRQKGLSMLSFRTIEPHTLELLRHLMQMPCFGELRLVGGTALALQYGHRTSVDLDLFGRVELGNDEFLALLRYNKLRQMNGDGYHKIINERK